MEKVRIQDDLFNYVNGEWIEQAIIPDDQPSVGGFADLADAVEKNLMADLDNMNDNNNYPNTHLENACKLYKKALNVKKRNKDGIKPALKMLKKIDGLKDIADFNKKAADLIINGFVMPFEIETNPDMKDTKHSILYIQGPSTLLPDTTMYKDENRKNMMLGLVKNMFNEVLAKTNLSQEEINKYIEDTLYFDSIVATLVKSREEWSEYTKMYNIYSINKVVKQLKPVNFKKILKKLGVENITKMSVADPRFLAGFNTLFNEENFVAFKHWCYVRSLIKVAPYLSEDLRFASGIFQRALTGSKVMTPIAKYAYRTAMSCYSEPIGIYYGDKYFGQEAKKDVISMVKEIVETYKRRIKENNFLEASTKEKAIKKLGTMNLKMGYPDKAEEIYDKFIIDDKESLFEAIARISRIRKEENLAKLNKDVDPSEWAMPGCLVNACYNPFVNDITFPAAILQAPFYSVKQTRSQNLGGIGAVIGHEISHAFDNNGAKFDEFGNLFDWWTKKDLKNFEVKTKAMIDQFDGIELPAGKVNASFIVSENIADNGGVAVSLDIMSRTKDANYVEYFTNWAKVWCIKQKPEFEKLKLVVDVHGPAILRTNMPPRNFAEWYSTFGVTNKDKMYIEPKKRVVIW